MHDSITILSNAFYISKQYEVHDSFIHLLVLASLGLSYW